MTAVSSLASNFEVKATWSFPLATIIGKIHCLAKVMVKDAEITGWKSKILGYISNGLKVPEVMTTDWNLSKTGRMAMEASKHRKCITGLNTVGALSSQGSINRVKPMQIHTYHLGIVITWVQLGRIDL